MAEALQFSDKQFKELMGEILKHTPASTALPAGGLLHGPTQDGSGNWQALSGVVGVRPEMWSAMARPRTMAALLGTPVKSINYNELFEIQTGVTPASGTNATDYCHTPPDVTGDMKVCRQSVTFGEYYGKTKLVALPNVGQARNYGDVPREIINAGPANHPLMPDLMFDLTDTFNTLRYNLWLFGQGFELTLERVLIQGLAALAPGATQLGWISEINGLDWWIRTGYTDSVSGTTCPAVDSLVINYATALGNTMAGCGDGRYIQEAVQDMVYGLRTRADQTRVVGYELAAVMRQELFHVLTEYIACNYASTNCSLPGTNVALTVDGGDYIRWRDGMRQGQYLLVHGEQVPVVFSDGIDLEGIGPDSFRTDIYFVPVRGNGRQLTYLQYFPLDNTYATQAAGFPTETLYTPMNNGFWAISKAETPLCIEYHLATKPRMIMETPWLAGRIDNIEFCYDTDLTRDPYSGESMYADGGVSYRTI